MTEIDGRSDLAYRLIRRAIAEGDFEPGSRLVEQRIGEMFDLSRTRGRYSVGVSSVPASDSG
ncbi:GntR family transcriptional regulator [Mycobacterium montefiorense]|uniref:GntR family transcriptional regulator n=1 Tax=Mycobacterium montefiorense TaxID=154654 RepID=UPI0021F34256|nr:GntR family transcriptional regulator [Mycobacterium montefiorense]MCV7425653.1 GntR family transcriptional regulator [Mycobacterium montefiorense]